MAVNSARVGLADTMRDLAEQWTKTTCPYCGVGCGVLVNPSADGEAAVVRGDPDHPANFGRLCSKGSALGETLSLDDRLLSPAVHGTPSTWDEALTLVAGKFSKTIARHGPDSVALYVSGQILTEDYYVANKFMKGFIGSANIDTNSRLCMASSVAGHKRAFGSDTVPGTYQDLELADLVVLVGSNLAWCHPVLYQRLAAARESRGTKIVVIDPRETATCDIADLHLALHPGSDVALFNGLLAHLAQSGSVDSDYVHRHTIGFDEAMAAAGELSREEIQSRTRLTQTQLEAFFELFATNENVVTVYSQGVNQSAAGTDKVNAILNCHLATGRIGRPGSGPFSVTGQPNAMGGREVGGLANMLAAHMEIADPEHRRIVQAFWSAPTIAAAPGYKAVDLFQAIGDGRVKAVWIMATNPVDSLPNADAVRDALAACPFVVVSDVSKQTDTMAVADVQLPAAAWGEKDGTVTNSERRISRQRSFLSLPGDVRPDWWQICEVAKRMGFGDAFAYDHPAAIFAEYATLTGAENNASRDLDISAYASVDVATYNDLQPFQWPQPRAAVPVEQRFFAQGGFFTPDGRARFVATEFRRPASQVSADYPLVLNTGRIRDQWHTMTRTGKAPRLTSHYAEPFVEIHPRDASACGIETADLAEIESAHGRVVVRTICSERVLPGQVFAPMHWTAQFTRAGRVGTLIGDHVDPVSGQPELKFTPVGLKPFRADWYGFAVTQRRPDPQFLDYVAIAPVMRNGWRVELADARAPSNWHLFADRLLASDEAPEIDVLAYLDARAGQFRFAAFSGRQCVGLFYVSRGPVTVPRTWAIEQLGCEFEQVDRMNLLAGRPGDGIPDRGPVVCACFEVGRNEILDAITDGRCHTVAAVGSNTSAGTNCGSCRAEIGKLIDDARLAQTV